MISFLICEFGKSSISNLVKECFGSAFPDIFNKKQVDYIYRYLSELKAKSVLLEFDYVDKDYLEDYTKFYAQRFSSRGHRCARLHFFSNELTHLDFEKYLSDPEAKPLDLQSAYLGFVVIKPLPKTFIGKTCLKPYSGFKDRPDRIGLTRRYDVNLFGVALSVESIAFQEQDKVVSACATTAIWSALHALHWLNLRDISSCSKITANAINFIDGSSNSFPRTELSNKQILRALDAEGLRHHEHSLAKANKGEAVAIIKAYLQSGLPLILGSRVYRLDTQKPGVGAGHAATIVGCELTCDQEVLYVNDDRFGPFARARFVDLTDYPLNGVDFKDQTWGLILQEKDDQLNWLQETELLVPDALFGMTHKKVRIPVDLVLHTCEEISALHGMTLDLLAETSAPTAGNTNTDTVKFDIRLREISEFKNQVHTSPLDLEVSEKNKGWAHKFQQQKIALLTSSLARFQWVARFHFGEVLAFTLLIDATDIPQGDAVSALYEHDPIAFEAIIVPIQAALASKSHEDIANSNTLVGSFVRRLTPVTGGLQEHLNKSYGPPRAPLSLKDAEINEGRMRNNATVRFYYETVDQPIEDEFVALMGDDKPLIWVIDIEGTLLVGKEEASLGHPTLTGFKPARIAGELLRVEDKWKITTKSGRYSGDHANTNQLLDNAVKRFKAIFYMSRDSISAEPWKPDDSA